MTKAATWASSWWALTVEILGDLHNLFGDTHSADICMDADGKPVITHVIRGDNVDNLLRYVNIDPQRIRENYQALASHPSLDEETRTALLADLDAGLQGYAYLEDDE